MHKHFFRPKFVRMMIRPCHLLSGVLSFPAYHIPDNPICWIEAYISMLQGSPKRGDIEVRDGEVITPPPDHAAWTFYLEFAAPCLSDEVNLAALS